MITSLDKLKEFIRINNAPYWTLYRGTGLSHTEKVCEVDHEKPGMSMTDSLDRLTQCFDVLGGGRFSIKAKTKGTDIKAGVYTETIDLPQSGVHAVGGVGGAGLSKQDIQEAIANERTKWDNERKLEKLQEEITELKKQGPLDRLIAGLAPTLEPILTRAVAKVAGIDLEEKAPVAVAGFGADQQASQEELLRVQKALETLDVFLAPKGYNVIDVLEKLAKSTTEKPDMVLMALKML